ncbi:MAG: hypothetical protein ABFR47_01215 [Verrucomicrobiota bacterium]
MDLFALILYGATNILMVLYYQRGKSRFYQFPFWAGAIALGWFFPQAVGGYSHASDFPEGAYADGMLFASLCTLGLWAGFELALARTTAKGSWLGASFDVGRLYYAGALLCLVGFFFQWKLWSLPEEMLAQSQWSGATVKYLFLASVFKFGFLILWLLYLSQPKVIAPKLLVFILPCLGFLLGAAVLRGRRSEMMNLFSYLAVGLWLVRRISVPRWVVTSLLALGLVFINGIGIYRGIMKNKDVSLAERLTEAANADYLSVSKTAVEQSGAEFTNYIYYRQVYVDLGIYDFGLSHWNKLVFNYVPGQLVGREFKESLYYLPTGKTVAQLGEELYGYQRRTGSTNSGYKDSFGSFGWFGFIKFGLIGYIAGALYRYAMGGHFLGQLLYLYVLTTAMQSITHGSNALLVRVWVYFFMLCYPVLFFAKVSFFRPAEGTRSKCISSG